MRLFTARRLAFLCSIVGASAVLGAQQPPAEQRTFRTEVALVEVVAVVTGEGHRSVLDLSAADFEVREDGELRRLALFRRLTSRPSTTRGPSMPAVPGADVEQLATNTDAADGPAFVLVLDDLNTSPYDTHRVIRAAQGALRAIPDEALVAVLTTSGIDGSLLTLARPGPQHIERIRKFRGQLLLAGPKGKRLGPETTPSSVNAPCGVGSGVLNSQDCGDPTRAARRAETIAAAAQILGRAGTRRKALFWITPDMGISPLDPEGNRRAQRQALRQAVNSGVAVYAVDPRENITKVELDKDDNRPDRTSGGSYRVGTADAVFLGKGGGVLSLDTDDMVAVPLTQIARETGGQYITAANDLESVLARAIEQNTTSYLLAYETPVSRVPGRHTIDVRVLRAGTRVFARRGYVVSPEPPASGPQVSPQARILRDTLMGSVPQGQLRLVVHVAPQFADGRHGRAVVTVKLDDDGSHGGAVDLMLATIDEAGRAGNQRQIRMAPPPSGEPWEATTELPLERGRHQLRVAAVTADASRTGLVLTSVEIVEPGRDLAMTPPVLLDFTAGLVHPTAVRTFASGNPLGVQVEVGGRSVQQKTATVSAMLLDRDGRTVREVEAVLDAGARSDRMRATAALTTAGLPEGEYVLLTAARARAAAAPVRRAIPIVLRGSSAATSASAAAAGETGYPRVPHTTVAHGPTSWHPKAATLVIRTEQEWAEFWKQLPTRQPPPAIDFARVTLLAIVLEGRAGGLEQQPSVSRVEQAPDGAVVYWHPTGLARPPDVPVDTLLRPFIVVGVTERVGVVRFQRVGDP